MANTTTNVLPKLLAQGLLALRQNAVLPRVVNRDYDGLAAQPGAVINIPLPSSVTVTNVTPSVTPASNQDISPTVAVVTLDFWKEATFQLSDKDVAEVMNGVIPMQASEAIKGLANAVDNYILGKHTGIFGAVGTAGTSPFNGSLTVAGNARAMLNKQNAPVDERRAVIDPDADANLLLNAEILQWQGRGDTQGIIKGTIGTKMGIDWYMDQNIPSYTPGAAWITGWSSDGSAAIGATTLAVTFTNSGAVKVGDIFSLTAGGAGLGYVITAVATAVTATTLNISFYPPLRVAVATASLLFIGAGATAYVANLVFHRDAFAWASRPLQDVSGLGNSFESAVDPVSGVALRLEMSRQYKQTTFSYDILGGAALIRPELAVKVKG